MAGTIRRVAKWALWALGVVLVLIALYLSVFFLPYPLFRNHLEHAGFSVYSDREIPSDFEAVLDDARRRVDAMELAPDRRPPRLFVCQSQRLFAFYVRAAGLRHTGQGLLISVAGNAFFSQTTINRVARRNGARPHHSRLEGSWAAAIAHEVAHDRMFAELGFRDARRLPAWKSEGYADYSANLAAARSDPNFDLRHRITILLDDSSWQGPTGPVDRRHFGWQLLVDYLVTVEGHTFAELIDPSLTEQHARARMMAWYDADL
jgi:hypothetical protein